MAGPDRQPSSDYQIRRVYASVALAPQHDPAAAAEFRQNNPDVPAWLTEPPDPDMVSFTIKLSAEDIAGARITASGAFGVGGPRKGPATMGRERPRAGMWRSVLNFLTPRRLCARDIEDEIDHMLGRDVTFPPPPRLAWGSLIAALDEAGLHVIEQELIAAPLVVQFGEDVVALLGKRHRSHAHRSIQGHA